MRLYLYPLLCYQFLILYFMDPTDESTGGSSQNIPYIRMPQPVITGNENELFSGGLVEIPDPRQVLYTARDYVTSFSYAYTNGDLLQRVPHDDTYWKEQQALQLALDKKRIEAPLEVDKWVFYGDRFVRYRKRRQKRSRMVQLRLQSGLQPKYPDHLYYVYKTVYIHNIQEYDQYMSLLCSLVKKYGYKKLLEYGYTDLPALYDDSPETESPQQQDRPMFHPSNA